jgi:NADH-quinone oxidoreductase subunit H
MSDISLVSFLLFAGKAFFVVMFAMNVAVILTWVDRRQGAVMQDRVGPNRAVIWLPTPLVQGLMLLPALAAAGGVIFLATQETQAPDKTTRAILFSHLAILMTWLTGLVIAGRVKTRGPRTSFDAWIHGIGDPRRIFYAGLAAHGITAFAAALFREAPFGGTLRDFGFGGGAAVLAAVILFGALYAVYSLHNEPRVGLRLAGLLHPAADGLKTLFKEDHIPPNADRFLHAIAPIISFFPALVVLGVVPFGDTLCFGTHNDKMNLGALIPYVPREGLCTDGAVPLQVIDLNVGILYFFALAGTGIVGAALAGWSSDSKFSLLGGLRAASQMVSYEVTLGLTIIGAIMVYGTLRVDEMVRWQVENAWGIFVQPLAFVLFFSAAVAESKRIPFDIPEGESEIVAGYYTEYSGMKFAMFFFAEYIAVVTSSALMAALFLGGWHLPFVHRGGLHLAIGDVVIIQEQLPHVLVIVLGVLAFVGKTLLLCWLQVTIRWTLPRFRYDQLMRLGWRKLLPASLVNILVTGLVVLAIEGASEGVHSGLKVMADLSEALVAVAGAGAFVWLIVFLLKPVQHRRVLASTAAQFAAAMGGTREREMEA